MMKSWILLVVAGMSSQVAQAYPDFVGLGYNSCLACHVHGAGGGPLSDYGRAVWGSEIAARPFWNPRASDDSLGESSGFLGKKELPFWIRPNIKFRDLYVDRNLGSQTNRRWRNVVMQSSLQMVFHFNQAQTWSLMMDIGSLDQPYYGYSVPQYKTNPYLIAREYYLKVPLARSHWLYIGRMDKVFGIRHPDHTSSNRGGITIGQNDQSDAVLYHYAGKTSDIFAQYLNPSGHMGELRRVSGGSIMGEMDLREKTRIGLSLLSESGEQLNHQVYAMHFKRGVNGGHSFLLELGQEEETLSQANLKESTLYGWNQNLFPLQRGLYFMSQMQVSATRLATTEQDSFRWSMGFMWFPAQRYELRLTTQHERFWNPSQYVRDAWDVQSQLRLSL